MQCWRTTQHGSVSRLGAPEEGRGEGETEGGGRGEEETEGGGK